MIILNLPVLTMLKVAPDPTKWPTLVAKVKQMILDFKGFTREELAAIEAPVLITLGDRDGLRVEHAVELFRQIKSAQLAVFPAADHFLIMQGPEKLFPPIVSFLDAPMPEDDGRDRRPAAGKKP
jgi:pimeloyl-ACP methyl ester carboxylesterase